MTLPQDTGLFDGRPIVDDVRGGRRVSWGALLSGVVIAFAIQLLLSLVGAVVGFGGVSGAGASPSANTLGVATGVWWVVSSCLALFAGGFAAAWLAGSETRFGGALHGVVTWGLVTALTVYLISTVIGSLLGGGFSALGSVASAAGSGAKEVAAPVAESLGVSPGSIKDKAGAFLQPTDPDPATMSPQDAQKEVAKDLATYEQGGPDAPAAKARIVDIMAAQTKISQPDAAKKFDAAQLKIDDAAATAKKKAAEAADAASAAAAKGTLALLVDLLLGALAAALGGALATGSSRVRVQAARVP